MQLFKAFFKIARKRLGATSIYFIIYAGITVFLSMTASDFYTGQFQASALTIAVTDEDQSAASAALTAYLSSMHHVTEGGGDREDVLDQIYYRTLDYALTIPAGFEEKLLAGDTDRLVSSLVIPGNTSSYYVELQISEYLTAVELYLAGGYDLASATKLADDTIDALPVAETVSFAENTDTLGSSLFYYFQYLPYIFIVILFSGLAPILITFHGRALKARTDCSALTPKRRVGELSVGCILYSFAMWVLFLLLCLLLYGKEVFTKRTPQLAVLNSFVFLLFAVGLTLLISCFPFGDNILNMVSNIVGLSMSFLCGVFVPQTLLPAPVLDVAKFLPAYWYIRANNMLASFGEEIFDMGFYWQCIGIQLLFAAAMFALALVAARQTRRQS